MLEKKQAKSTTKVTLKRVEKNTKIEWYPEYDHFYWYSNRVSFSDMLTY